MRMRDSPLTLRGFQWTGQKPPKTAMDYIHSRLFALLRNESRL